MKVLDVISERCTGCRICEQWCTWQHAESVGTPSRIHIKRLHHEYSNMLQVCRQCEDSPCIVSCKFDALSVRQETGAIEVNLEKCIGCRICMKHCPHNAIFFDKANRKVRICDLCNGKPKCVLHCPENALDYVTMSERGKKHGTCQGLWSQEVSSDE